MSRRPEHAVALLAWAALWVAACGDPTERRNLVFVTIDTLRADHLSGYGYPRPTSPAIDAFLESAVVFEDAQANSAWTLPSLASFMTSLYASTHGVVDFQSRLDDSFVTLAERLAEAGYRTAGVASHTLLRRHYGLQQGFDEFDESLIYNLRLSHLAVSSDGVTRSALRWLGARAAETGGRPWFLWLHYFDPHFVYVAHEGISERFGTSEPVDLYDGEVRFVDAQLGPLLARLEELGMAGSTVVVLTSDHGEAFGDHGLDQHGSNLFAEITHIPLAIRDPRYPPRRVAERVQSVDLLPTVLELLDVPAEGALEGRSLVPAMGGASLPERPVLAETELGRDYVSDSLVLGRWKLVADRSGALRRTPEGRVRLKPRSEPPGEPGIALFDLERDPGETRDVAGEHPEVAERLRARLEAMLAGAAARRRDFDAAAPHRLSDEEVESLRALGYTEAGEP